MKKYVVTAALIVAFVTPALAADYYVALRLGGGGGCIIMTHAPNATKYKMMGHYTSRSQAKKAMTTMTECK
jgi:accessory gene regulator protein AgrB